ncbi:MAG: GNAT family N-acetyltransferase [Methanobacteriaceae archaeon]
MIIKKATIKDAAEILALQRLAYLSEAAIYDDYTIKPLVQTLDDIKGDFDDYVFLKVIEGDVIIGSVRARLLEDGSCYIGRLMVHPHHQNQGIGKRLIGEVEKIFNPCPRFELTTGHQSHQNMKFYQKQGYSPYKREKVTDNIYLVHLEKITNER